MWRSFQYNENSGTTDSCISKIKQVAALLNYRQPQILELFKNTLPSKLYWILFPITNLRDAVDAMKRELTKEKLGQGSPLMGHRAVIVPGSGTWVWCRHGMIYGAAQELCWVLQT